MKRIFLDFCLLLGMALIIDTPLAQNTPVAAKPAPVGFNDEGFRPYAMPWQVDGKEVLADLSFLNEKPAGKDGFIRIIGEHFVTGRGKRRFRIWGVNMTFGGMTPPKEDAPAIAAHLARFGINAVRAHHVDNANGILNKDQNVSGPFDADALDRFDYFIAELKKQGIYINLNMNVSRAFREGDGVRDYKILGYGKGATYFNPRLIELQKEYARALLTHKNPYTGNEYRNEPAVCTVELVNENSLLESWLYGRLVGTTETTGKATWRPIPVSYDQELTGLYNEWLKKTLSSAELAELRRDLGLAEGAPVPRLSPGQFAKASKMQFHTEYEFYQQTEQKFFDEMFAMLKRELGVRVPVIGNSIHSKRNPYQYMLPTCRRFDALDTHVYWNHPETRTNAQGKTMDYFKNTAMVNDPAASTVVTLARSRMAGRPFTVSEVNHPFPTDYLADGFPALAAYASFHDWDGIYWFDFDSKSSERWETSAPGNFTIRQDPIKMSQLATGALLFLRGDVAPSRAPYERTLTREECIESLKVDKKYAPYYTPGFPDLIALAHGTRITAIDKKDERPYPPNPAMPVKSDTGELEWNIAGGKGLITIGAPRSQGVLGFLKGAKLETPNMTARVDNVYGALTLASVDEKPIAEAERLILTAGARVALAGQRWNAERTMLDEKGKLPMTIEPVTGTVTLTGLKGASGVEAVALDGAGRALGGAVAAKKAGDGWMIDLGKTPTTWYLVRVTR